MDKPPAKPSWILPFAISLCCYAAALFVNAQNPNFTQIMMGAKSIGFVFLMWAIRNKIISDWKRFSAKRSASKKNGMVK